MSSTTTRATRILAALAVVDGFASNPTLTADPLAYHLSSAAAHLDASGHTVRCYLRPLREALDGMAFTSFEPCVDTYSRLALDVVAALCGNAEAFDGLSKDRRASVLRYALACIALGTDPLDGWARSVAIGPAVWGEVVAVVAAQEALAGHAARNDDPESINPEAWRNDAAA